jgi:hypothetical protein
MRKLIRKEDHFEIWEHQRGYDVIDNRAIESFTGSGMVTNIFHGAGFNLSAPGVAERAFNELKKGNSIGKLTIIQNL